MSKCVRKIAFLVLCVISTCAFALSAGCANGKESKDIDIFVQELEKSESAEKASVNSVSYSEEEINDFSAEEKEKFKVVGEEPEGDLQDDYYASYTKYSATGAYSELMSYGQYDDILYPGAIVDISNSALKTINLEQSPITMSLSLESVSNETFRPYVMTNPSLSSARTGINKMINTTEKTTDFPAKVNISTKVVSNSSEFNLALGLTGGYMSFAAGVSLDYNDAISGSELVFVLSQIYYTVDIDGYKSASNYFLSTYSDNDIKEQLKGKTPAVVSSVTYGRIAIVRIKEYNSTVKLGAGLNASYSNIFSFSSDISSLFENNDLSCSVSVYGGTLRNGSYIGTGMKLKDIIDEFNGEYAPDVAAAVPISYRLRHIADYSAAKIIFTNDDLYLVEYKKRYCALRLCLTGIELYDEDGNIVNNSKIILTNFNLKGHLVQKNAKGDELSSYDGSRSVSYGQKMHSGKFEISNCILDITIDRKTLSGHENFLYFNLKDSTFNIYAEDVSVGAQLARWFSWLIPSASSYGTENITCIIPDYAQVAGLSNMQDGFYFDAQSSGSNSKFRLNFSSEIVD